MFNEGEIFKELTYKNDNLVKEKIYLDTLHTKERHFSNNSLTKESLYKGNILIKDDIYKNGKLIKTKKFLIPNSGFEIYNKLPYSTGIGDECIFAWSNPNDGTPDYFHYDSSNPFTQVPKNQFGLQQAHSGNAYAGLFSENNWKEYLQTKLISPLVKDMEYKINFFLCRGEIFTNDTINEIGIFFTENPFRQAGAKKLNLTPQIIFDDKETYINAHTWIPMSAIYKAKGNENYITIGFVNDNYKITYYYIDDISIEKLVPMHRDL
ncbi:unnamed protein product, partial [marine sediment metagenome]